MNAGILSRQQNFPKHSVRIMGTAICLIVTFVIGWSAHAHVIKATPNSALVIHAPFFSPNGGARDAIHAQIEQADSEILVVHYYFSTPLLAEALIAAKNRAVIVKVILDRSQKNGRHSQVEHLTEAGVSVYSDSKHRISRMVREDFRICTL